MDDVIRHPWFMKEADYTLPANIPELPCQHNQSAGLERNTLNIMKTLLDCNMSSTILSAVYSERYVITEDLKSTINDSSIAKQAKYGANATFNVEDIYEDQRHWW